MKPWKILCLLVLLSSCSGEEFIFFADDHYKALGVPRLNASPTDPVLTHGDCVLEIALANNGRVEELIPVGTGGSPEDISLEMQEEMHSADALNITARLEASGGTVTAAAQHIPSLPAGSRAELAFNLSAPPAEGWQDLWLNLEYEHQMDVSVAGGAISPLYQPDSSRQKIRVLVRGTGGPEVLGAVSDLAAGGQGRLSVAIRNSGRYALKNCTARLKAAPPISYEGRAVALGDIPAGGLAAASFSLSAAGNASLERYQLACEIIDDNGTALLMVPLSLRPQGWRSYTLPILALLLAASALLLWRRLRMPRRRRLR